MLKKLTSTTCTLAILLCIPSHTYADEFDDAILSITKAASPEHHLSRSSTSASALADSGNHPYLEHQVADSLEQYRDHYISKSLDQLLAALGRFESSVKSLKDEDIHEFARLTANENNLRNQIQNIRLEIVFPQVKGSIDKFWPDYTILASLFTQNMLEDHQSDQFITSTTHIQHSPFHNFIEHQFELFNRRASEMLQRLWWNVDSFLRGRNFPESQIVPELHYTFTEQDLLRNHDSTSESSTQDNIPALESTPLSTTIFALSLDLADRVMRRFGQEVGLLINPPPTFHNGSSSDEVLVSAENPAQRQLSFLPAYPNEPLAELVARTVQRTAEETDDVFYLAIPEELRRGISSQFEAKVYQDISIMKRKDTNEKGS